MGGVGSGVLVEGDVEAGVGEPLTLTIPPTWMAVDNIPGSTVFVTPDAPPPGDPAVVFMRPAFLADPSQPGADVAEQVWWPLDDIEGWSEELIDGIITAEPVRTEIGGRGAWYLEVDITDPEVCGPFGHCAGFVINAFLGPSFVSAWSFEPGYHQRIWWVDGGDQPPLAVIASTPSDDRSGQTQADALLDSVVFGEPGPHPVDTE